MHMKTTLKPFLRCDYFLGIRRVDGIPVLRFLGLLSQYYVSLIKDAKKLDRYGLT